MRLYQGLCVSSFVWLVGVGCASSTVPPPAVDQSGDQSEQALRRHRHGWGDDPFTKFAVDLLCSLFDSVRSAHSVGHDDQALVAGSGGGPSRDMASAGAGAAGSGTTIDQARLEELGKRLFEDTRLSATGTQSCASCHDPTQAFAGNDAPDEPDLPVARGAKQGQFGTRNVPTAMYALFSPSFGFELEEGELTAEGGQFWDGRATSLSEQAGGPFINPREMAMPDKASVIDALRNADYAPLFEEVFGPDAFDDVDSAYMHLTDAIAAFERTEIFHPFSSKFDAYLRGEVQLSEIESQGFRLFTDERKGNCVSCHVGTVGSRDPVDWLFTDHTYDALGVPRNAKIADNADPEYYDLGLCAVDGLASKLPDSVEDKDGFIKGLCGAFKVPTLRNSALTAPYMHNGRFASLHDVVSFYVTRDTDPARWYPTDAAGNVQKFDDLPAQYAGNVNTEEVPYDRLPGDAPRLSPDEIDAVVAFLHTLTDGYDPAAER